MLGSNLSADSGARPWRGRACRFALFSIPHMGWHNRDKSWGSQGAKPPVCCPRQTRKPENPTNEHNAHNHRALPLHLKRMAAEAGWPSASPFGTDAGSDSEYRGIHQTQAGWHLDKP